MLLNLRYRLSERWGDWRWGVRTYDYLLPEELGLSQDGCAYSPIPFPLLRRLLDRLPAELKRGALMDFGCGMGRVLIAAHRSGFQRSVGVEASPQLCRIARENTRGRPIEIIEGDAGACSIPDDVTTVFFHNPFRGSTLVAVLQHVAEHAARRPCWLVVSAPANFYEAAVNCPPYELLAQGHFRYPPQDWLFCRFLASQAAPAAGRGPSL
ncbi:MAG: class I SAM-dependent methyltransferase [Terriglobales bacterium]